MCIFPQTGCQGNKHWAYFRTQTRVNKILKLERISCTVRPKYLRNTLKNYYLSWKQTGSTQSLPFEIKKRQHLSQAQALLLICSQVPVESKIRYPEIPLVSIAYISSVQEIKIAFSWETNPCFFLRKKTKRPHNIEHPYLPQKMLIS